MQPLASAGSARSQSGTNLSTSVGLSLFDSNGHELTIRADPKHPIELMVPRDSNVFIPPMAMQNVTSVDIAPHQQLFNLHFVNITSPLPISVHFEMRPLNISLAYLFVYRFDSAPQLNTSINLIDGWASFCPASEFLPSHSSPAIHPVSLRYDKSEHVHLLHRQSAGAHSPIGGVWSTRAEYYRDRRCLLQLCCPASAHHRPANEFHGQLRASNLHLRMLLSRLQKSMASRWSCGWITYRSLPDPVLFDASDDLCGWFHCAARASELELCLRQR